MTISDINSEIRALCDADSTSLTDAVLLRRVNNAYEEVVGEIIQADGTWQFDDTNYSTTPIGTTTLVSGQRDYSFDTTMLNIERVEVLDNSGNYYLLKPLDKTEIDIALSEFNETNGRPEYYDKNGSSIYLYPAPDAGVSVTLAAGLRVYFQRTADIFTSAQVTTGTKVPGFISPYHQILCYMAAIPYCMSYKKDRVALYVNKVAEIKKAIIEHYSRREKDIRKVMTMEGITYE